jgi:uncharacterized metal-binding protein
MANEHQTKAFSCTSCGLYGCNDPDGKKPSSCLTLAAQDQLTEVLDLYHKDDENRKFAQASAEIEGLYYGKMTRAEEVIAFAKRIGVTKVGIASCLGLIDEARIFHRALTAKGLEGYAVACKVGSTDKTAIGIRQEHKVKPEGFEAMCNPILQAKLLNQWGSQFNVLIGLCVGHDTLFIKYSEAPVTTLIAKDRVLAHNPVAALYTSNSYYRRLLQEES